MNSTIRPPDALSPFLLLTPSAPQKIAECAPQPLAEIEDVTRGPPDPEGTILEMLGYHQAMHRFVHVDRTQVALLAPLDNQKGDGGEHYETT